MLSKDKIELSSLCGYLFSDPYSNTKGHFFSVCKNNKADDAHTCRETFAWSWHVSKRSRIGFQTRKYPINAKRFAEYLEEIETKLNIENKTKVYNNISIEGLEYNDMIVLDLSPFWLGNTTRRSLLTLLIRGLICFPGNSISEKLSNYYLARECLPAIEYFLKGNTIPTFERLRGGFYNMFRNAKGEDTLSKLLISVKP